MIYSTDVFQSELTTWSSHIATLPAKQWNEVIMTYYLQICMYKCKKNKWRNNACNSDNNEMSYNILQKLCRLTYLLINTMKYTNVWEQQTEAVTEFLLNT